MRPNASPPAGKQVELAHEQGHKGEQQSNGDADLNSAFRQSSHPAGAEPGANDSAGDHEQQGGDVHLDHGDVDEGLKDDGQRMAGIERAGDETIRNHAGEFENRRGSGKRANAKGVEEVGDEAGEQSERRWNRYAAGEVRQGPDPDRQVGGCEDSQGHECRRSGQGKHLGRIALRHFEATADLSLATVARAAHARYACPNPWPVVRCLFTSDYGVL